MDDVPIAARLIRRSLGDVRQDMVVDFLVKHGKGSLDVLRLAELPHRFEIPSLAWRVVSVAATCAEGVRADELPAILELLPRLPYLAAMSWTGAFEPMVRPEHVAAIGEALGHCRGPEWADTGPKDFGVPVGNDDLARALVRLLRLTGDRAALPYLEHLLEEPGLAPYRRREIARAALEVAGKPRAALIREMLSSTDPEIVGAALGSEELRSDDQLRSLAFEVVFHFSFDHDCGRGIFDVLDEEQGTELALKILDHQMLNDLREEVVSSALRCLDGTKNGRYLKQLARACLHPAYQVRQLAAEKLGNTFVRKAAGPLLELLKDDVESVREQAQKSLDQIANYLEQRAKWEKRFGN